MHKGLFLSVIFFLSLKAVAQPVFFEKIFGNPVADFGRSVVQLPDNSFLLAGFSEAGNLGGIDISLSKLDHYGNLLWTKYYGRQYSDYALSMSSCTDGTFIITGESYDSLNGADLFLLRVDATGQVIWQKYYSSPLNESGKNVIQTMDGGFAVTGFITDSTGSLDVYMLKTDGVGNKQWDRQFGFSGVDYGNGIVQKTNGDFIIIGDSRPPGRLDIDLLYIQTDSSGNLKQMKHIGDTLTNGSQGLLITSQGNILVYGETEIYNASPFDYYVSLLDSGGTEIWTSTFGGSGSDASFSAVETSDGGFVFTGYSNSHAPLDPTDASVFKLDSLGNLSWNHWYGSPYIEIGYHIIKSNSNGFVIAGTSGQNQNDYHLIHVNADGILSVPDLKKGKPEHVKVYPNPASSEIIFELPHAMNTPILYIYNSMGTLLEEIPFKNGSGLLKYLSRRASGIYFYEIRDNVKSFHGTLILK